MTLLNSHLQYEQRRIKATVIFTTVNLFQDILYRQVISKLLTGVLTSAVCILKQKCKNGPDQNVVEGTNVITGHKCNKGHKCNNIWSQM